MGRKLGSFILRIAVIFGLLIIPWPGFRDAYGDYSRWIVNSVFGRDHGDFLIHAEAHQRVRGLATMDSQIVMANTTLISDCKCPADYLGFDSRAICWLPTALTIALILATPIPWRRRLASMLIGILLIHLYILAVFAIYIWNQSTTIGVITLPPFAKLITDALEYTFVTQIGPGFAVPILIWILVTFRQKDFKTQWLIDL